jgi:hypothetical protein
MSQKTSPGDGKKREQIAKGIRFLKPGNFRPEAQDSIPYQLQT